LFEANSLILSLIYRQKPSK